jgi:alpha-amylase
MCTKYFQDGDVHKYFSPYSTPENAYIYFMNILADLEKKLEEEVLV